MAFGSSIDVAMHRVTAVTIASHVGTAHSSDRPYHVIEITIHDEDKGEMTVTLYTKDISGKVAQVKNILTPAKE